jgi:hypothetical protein
VRGMIQAAAARQPPAYALVMRSRGLLFLALVLTAAAPHVSGQSASSVVLVGLEFRADRNGTPVADLRLDEVSVLVGGVALEIRALDPVRSGSSSTLGPFATNLTTRRGRDLVLVVDEDSLQVGGESRLRDALSAMVRQLTPLDRAGLISLTPSGPSVSLTSSLASVQAAIPRLRGRAIGTESATDLTCRTRRALHALSALMQGLDAGVTTSVLLFSNAMAAPAAAAVARPGLEVACLLTPDDFTEFRMAATRSPARLYAVHTGDATSTQLEAKAGAGLERLAADAGGQFLTIAGDASPAMNLIAASAPVSYVATVALDATMSRQARPPVQIKVKRDGVDVRSRAQLIVPPVESKTVSPRDMMRVATAFRDLPLRAAGVASRESSTLAKLVVLFEPLEPGVALTSAMAGMFNDKGQLVAQWNGERDALQARPVIAGLTAPPGKYRLRVAAVDSKGRSGAVDDELVVQVAAAGPAAVSGIVLGVPSQSGFAPALQFTATDPAAAAYLEVYGVSPCSALSGTIEIASSPQSPALAKGDATATQIEQSDACILFGGAEIKSLAPGDYTIRVEIRRGSDTIGRLTRVLRKSARG